MISFFCGNYTPTSKPRAKRELDFVMSKRSILNSNENSLQQGSYPLTEGFDQEDQLTICDVIWENQAHGRATL